MNIDLRKFFTKEAVAGTLSRLPDFATPVIDFLFPPAARINHPFPVIGYDDLGIPSGNIPVVRRGSPSIGLKSDDGSIKLIEPQPVHANSFLDAATLNNFRQLSTQGQQQLIDNRINSLRQVCRQTAEALAAQVLTGKISYPMRADGAMLVYEVDFGAPQVVTTTKKWDDPATKIQDIILSLAKIANAAKLKGYGIDMVFICGFDVYAALVEKIGTLNNSAVASVETDGIRIGTLKIVLLNANYLDLTTNTVVSSIPEKTIIAIDRAAGHRLFYASVDDLDADFAGMPFFSKAIKSDDPSGYKLIGSAKPLPVVNTKGMVKAQVLA